MIILTSLTFFLLFLRGLVNAQTPIINHGLIGYGINMYKPLCATACRDSTPLKLNCTSSDDSTMKGMRKRMDMDMEGPSMACIAGNLPYLQTVAYCMSTHCDSNVTVGTRGAWWKRNVVGSMANQPDPVYTYKQVLEAIVIAPDSTQEEGSEMSFAVLVDEETLQLISNTMGMFEWIEDRHSQYGLLLVTTTFAIPILLSLLRFTPIPPSFSAKIHSFLDASLFPPRYRLSSPTTGQSIFITYLISLNIILSSIGYRSSQPNAWFTTQTREIATYISNRSGVLSFANITILFLFAGRNNILLYLTDWSHSTFLLIHKVVGCIAVIQACLHSAMYLNFKLVDGTYLSDVKEPYWIMGVLATVTMALILPLSIRPIRKAAYEVFLVGHIVLSVLAVVGCWYHIVWRFHHTWGYETWLYIAIAFWAFDRLARLARMIKGGRGTVVVQKIDEDYLRIDGFVSGGAKFGREVYVYFPRLTWRVWENHPFSVAGVGCRLPRPVGQVAGEGKELGIEMSRTRSGEVDVNTVSRVEVERSSFTLLVRVRKGITLILARSADLHPATLSVLLETYNHDHRLISLINPTAAGCIDYPNMIFIAGGVGITAFLSMLSHYTRHQHFGTVKLYWSCRSSNLVKTVEEMLPLYGGDSSSGTRMWGHVNAEIKIGDRLDLANIVGGLKIDGTGTMIYACGPRGMMDSVRGLVVAKGKDGAKVRFFDENFDW